MVEGFNWKQWLKDHSRFKYLLYHKWERRTNYQEYYSLFDCIRFGIQTAYYRDQTHQNVKSSDIIQLCNVSPEQRNKIIEPRSPEGERIFELVENEYAMPINVYIWKERRQRIKMIRRQVDLMRHMPNMYKSLSLLYIGGYYFAINDIDLMYGFACCLGCGTVTWEPRAKHKMDKHEALCPRYEEVIKEGKIGPFPPAPNLAVRSLYRCIILNTCGTPFRPREAKQVYKEGIFKPRQYPSDDLERLGLVITDDRRKALQKRSMIVWDSESYLRNLIEEHDRISTDNLTYTVKHRMMCISAASNVPGFESAIFIDERRDEGEPNFIQQFLEWALECSVKAHEDYLMQPEVKGIFDELLHKSREARIQKKPALQKQLDFAMRKLDEYAAQLLLVTFNGGNYDMITFRDAGGFYYLAQEQGADSIKVTKKSTTYMVVQTPHLRFVDVLQFLGSKCSLREYLRSYQITTGRAGDEHLEKGYFCYHYLSEETLDNNLDDVVYEDFYNDMAASGNVLETEHSEFREFQ